MDTIANNLQHVRVRIRTACAAASRPAESVALLAVSKTFGVEAVRAAAGAGQRAFGENYVQEGVDKIMALRGSGLDLEWHCIGPLQSNKTRLVAEHFDWVQSVDRLKVAERLSAQRPEHLAPLQVCVQVNIDAAPSKAGVPPAEAPALCEAVARLPRLCLRGLMMIPDAVAAGTADSTAGHDVYASAARLFDRILASRRPDVARFDTLSLGMSDDLETAVRAGSTMVRVGSAVFGRRPRGGARA